MTRSFDVFFDLRLNKRLSKQRWGWWFETPSWSLCRHGNVRRYNHITRHRNYQVNFRIRVVTDTLKIKNDTDYVTVQWNKNVSLTLSEILRYPWWRHQTETFSALLAFPAGNSPVTGSFICTWIDGWVNKRKTGDLWRYSADYDVIVMSVSMAASTCRPGEMNFFAPKRAILP